MKRIFIILGLFAFVLTANSATKQKCNTQRNSFAIVVDKTSYEHCKKSIDAYCESVCNDGLNAFISSNDWTSPQVVKDSLKSWHKNLALEGAVFVGDIPIPMIRRAQFLTSAFKMNEKAYPKRDSSVPSDRYYDDFDLDFRFIERDSLERDFFYYELTSKGAQSIECEIYTARIKGSDAWRDKYEELDNYFKKLVSVREEKDNVIDRVTSYTGEGSFSNSMIAWVDETRILAEQTPDAFKDADGTRFFVFHQQPLMKDMLLKEACREDSDLYLFHCHGTPDRQWIGGYIAAEYFDDPNFVAQTYDDYYTASYKSDVELIKYKAREQYRRLIRYGRSKSEAAEKMLNDYGLDSTWYANAFEPEIEKIDSVTETKCSILLEDVQKYDTDSRVVLFDACYNGDFRENDNIATRYIMGKGKTVVGLGNSVNVLQDKFAQPLMGMLSAGYRIGEWQRHINILESHIIGDPTFHFASSYTFSKPDLENKSIKYWKKILVSDYPADIKALALNKISSLGAEDAINLIYDTYCKSDSYNLRLQAMLLSLHYDSPLSSEILVKALNDPYEFIRRKACYYLGKRGDKSTINALVDCYFRDYNAKRVEFNITMGAAMFEGESFKDVFEQKSKENEFIFDKEAFMSSCNKWLNSSYGMKDYMGSPLKDKSMSVKRRSSMISSLRNFPNPTLSSDVLSLIADKDEDMSLRIQCAEILGWYVYAFNRSEIIESLEEIIPTFDGNDAETSALIEELEKSLQRLKHYAL